MPRRTLFIALAVSALLTACANPAARTDRAGGAADRPPPPTSTGRAGGPADPLCQLATDTAVPAAKRSLIAAGCSRRRSSGIASVTKSTPSVALSTPTRYTAAPDCVQRALSARFLGAGYESGDDLGVIVIWNRSATSCQVQGRLTFAGYYADHSPDALATINRPAAAERTVLPAQMTPPRDGATDTVRYLEAYLAGTESDDPAQPDGMCRPSDEGTPATFVLGIGPLSFTVANHDPQARQVQRVYGCHGRVLLEGVDGPS